MNCFPLLYEDELFYSIMARYRRMCGIISGKALIKDLFGEPVTLSSAYFPTHLEKLIMNLPYSSKIDEEILLGNHTLYPYFTSLLSEEKTEDIYDSVKEGDGQGVILKIGMADNDIAMNKYLRFCPKCYKEDINILGESYWRRIHQIPGVLYCTKHRCPILNSTVMAVNSRMEQECADDDTCLIREEPIDIDDRLKKLNLELGGQVEYLLDNISKRKNLNFIIDFYIDRLRELKLTSASGNIYMKELEREFIDFFTMDYLEMMQVNFDIEKSNNWLRIFVRRNNKNRNPIKHLMFLQFLGIKVEDLFECKTVIGRTKTKTESSKKSYLDRDEMRDKWIKIIEENPDASRAELRDIAKGIRTWLYRNDRNWYEKSMPAPREKKGQENFVDWEVRDAECLKMSKKAVKEIMEHEGKPKRVSKSSIRRHLGLNFWFNNEKLVRTHEYIYRVEEDITSYRIRKIKWAIKDMTYKDETITPYKVQLYCGFGGSNKEVRELIEKELENNTKD